MDNKINRLLKNVPKDTKHMVAKNFDITEQILDILDEKGMSQKDLADKLGKSESEISRWMKGTHNFTIETVSKIEIALGETIIDTPKNFKNEQKAIAVANKEKDFAVAIDPQQIVLFPDFLNNPWASFFANALRHPPITSQDVLTAYKEHCNERSNICIVSSRALKVADATSNIKVELVAELHN